MIDRLTPILKKIFVTMVVCVQAFAPVTVWAEETIADAPSSGSETTSQPAEVTPEPAVSTQETTPQAESTPGPQAPTGADSNTYVYNKVTGLWENDYYTWDPVTKQTKPKQPQTYSYNPTTGQWDTTEWYYSPEAGKYLPNVISTAINPNPTAVLATPSSVSSAGNSGGSSISNTGPNSNNTVTNDGNTTGIFDLFFNSAVSNKIGQMSKSGDAIVQGNTKGGSALTGDATALATVLNLLQSAWGSLGSSDLAVFTANIDGDVVGDLYVDPSALVSGGGNTNLDVTIANDAAIKNNIDVTVASGSALVADNTNAGNATSGDARAVVNLLNLINSAISANKSFIGVLNINGNLNGDILLPPEMLNAIIAATGPGSNNQINSGGDTSLSLSSTDNKTINNNVNAAASTGNAAVSNNTTAGSASSGKADTNIVLLNLTGKKVIAKNALLVFVNVMGSWVGLIFDAPAGTNSVAATGPDSNNVITDNGNLTVSADVTTESLIDNNVNVKAASGDATVANNTTAGNASSGDASVGVNALNMIDSSFDISDWFGVLFINVFGNWVGSFGVNTAAGNRPATVGVVNQQSVAGTGSATVPQTFSFVAATPGATTTQAGATQPTNQTVLADAGNKLPAAVLASADTSGPGSGGTGAVAKTAGNSLQMAGIVTLFGVILLAGERILTQLRSRQMAQINNANNLGN